MSDSDRLHNLAAENVRLQDEVTRAALERLRITSGDRNQGTGVRKQDLHPSSAPSLFTQLFSGSWKTSLGGGLAAAGTFLWGIPIVLALQFPNHELGPALSKWCIILGLGASAGGVFFNGLAGRDNNKTSEQVDAGKK
jgi:hypothetical protein